MGLALWVHQRLESTLYREETGCPGLPSDAAGLGPGQIVAVALAEEPSE